MLKYGQAKMIFLIDYDRTQGRIIEFRVFSDEERTAAQEARLQREMSLGREGLNREIVLLDAAREEILRKTHRRYFEQLTELVSPAS